MKRRLLKNTFLYSLYPGFNKYLNRIWCEYKDINIVKLDYYLDDKVVVKYDVGTSLPVMIFKNDNETDRLILRKSYSVMV